MTPPMMYSANHAAMLLCYQTDLFTIVTGHCCFIAFGRNLKGKGMKDVDDERL